jgi:hypothetical protein
LICYSYSIRFGLFCQIGLGIKYTYDEGLIGGRCQDGWIRVRRVFSGRLRVGA